ncbi:inner membrane zinc metalloprotease [Entomoplasma ellychniae]|uniref:Inner membrane zinc metalloprotease n=1 Tax=Entomoplasma ellychniae TaxID=2114 RepID=A0A8E2QWP6_9MOLU|nr:M50 family metallopeptidase [Entomoplasma ellychniae]PPE05076.1 inner membrane zinc metalloprotease [Entomoplasma ellychniae]
MSVLFSLLMIVVGVVIVLVLITLHELGHFLFAKWSKAYVFEFSIGFGPRLFTIKTKETWYSVRILPLGGFVSIASDFSPPPNGREEEFATIPDERKIDYAVKWKKALFILAGPIVNLFIAFILIMSVFLSNGYKPNDMNSNGQIFAKDSVALKIIQELEPNLESDAQNIVLTGIQIKWNEDLKKEKDFTSTKYSIMVQEVSDYLSETNKLIKTEPDFFSSISLAFSYQQIDKYTQKVNGEIKDTGLKEVDQDILENWKNQKVMRIGIQPPHKYFKNNWSAFGYSFVETWNQAISLIKGLGSFFTGHFNAISGPLGMFNTSGATTSVKTNYALYIAGISANLFMLNMLPFPPLDGFKFWEALIEWITKKEMNTKLKTIVYIVGAIFLLGLMIIVTIKDIII